MFALYFSFDVLCFVLYALLLVYTLRGSILDTSKRKPVPLIIYGLTAMYVLILVVNTLASVYKPYDVGCAGGSSTEIRLGLAIFIWHWALWALFFVVALLAFDPAQAMTPEARYVWRLRILKCADVPPPSKPGAASHLGDISDSAFDAAKGGAGETSPLEQIGALMQLVFASVDMTTTDYWAAVYLLGNRQRMIRGATASAEWGGMKATSMVDADSSLIGPSAAAGAMAEAAATAEAAGATAGAAWATAEAAGAAEAAATAEVAGATAEAAGATAAAEAGTGVRLSRNAPQPPVTIAVIDDASYYWRHACAVYGWLSNIMNLQDVSTWGMQACCQCAPTRNAGPVDAGRWVSSKKMTIESLKHACNVDPATDLLYISWDNATMGLLPYYIIRNKERKEVVVAVRGSLSASDWLTDLLCLPAEVDGEFLGIAPDNDAAVAPEAVAMDVPGSEVPKGPVGRDVLAAHKGMLAAARAIIADINRRKVLRATLKGDAAAQAELNHPVYEQDYSGYSLTVTGHSLGAGVAALLALHLRPRYAGVACWAFAPPGGLLSPALSARMRPYCTSVVVGRDIVPRLTLTNMESLARQMLECAAHCRQPKLRILMNPGKRWKEEELFKPGDEVTEEAAAALSKFKASTGSAECAGGQVEHARGFVPPGRILYYEVNDFEEPGASILFTPRWIGSDEFIEGGIVVGAMAVDMHLPQMYATATDQVLTAAHRGEFEGKVDRATPSIGPTALAAVDGRVAAAACGDAMV